MKPTFFASIAVSIAIGGYMVTSVSADNSEPGGLLRVYFPQKTVTLGEPLLLKYRITNTENRKLDAYLGKDRRGWMTMHLVDASGNAVQPIPETVPVVGGISVDGMNVDAEGSSEGCIVVSEKFQPTHPGQYRLSLSSHIIYSWDDTPGEIVTSDQKFSLSFTIAPKDPRKLLAVAESLRQVVLHNNVGGDKLATEELFSMNDPICLPVWRKLALDPKLDPWRALYAAKQLSESGSVNASDILAEMQAVAPERWAQTGASPLDALERMQQNSPANTKQHIAQLLLNAGISPDHPPVGSAN